MVVCLYGVPLWVAALIVGGWVKKSCSFGSDIAAPLFCSKNSFYSKSFIFKIVCVLWGLCSVSVIFLFPADKLRGGLISPPLLCWACFLNKRIFCYKEEGLRCRCWWFCTFLLTPAGAAGSIAKAPVSAELFPE